MINATWRYRLTDYVHFVAVVAVIAVMICSGCSSERYREDRSNRLSAKAVRGHHFLAKQSIKITQKNIRTKEPRLKAAHKKRTRQQNELNELNANSSKVKKNKKFSGDFMFY